MYIRIKEVIIMNVVLTHQSTSYSVRSVTMSTGLYTVIFSVQPGLYRAGLFSVMGSVRPVT